MKKKKSAIQEFVELYIPSESFIKEDAKDMRRYIENVKMLDVNIRRFQFASPFNIILVIVNLITLLHSPVAFWNSLTVSLLLVFFNLYMLHITLASKANDYKDIGTRRKYYKKIYYLFWWFNGIALNILAFIRYDLTGEAWMFILACITVSLGPICTYKDSYHPLVGSLLVFVLIIIDYLNKNDAVRLSTLFLVFVAALVINLLCFSYQRLTALSWTMLSYIRLKMFLDPLTKLMTRKGANVVLRDSSRIDHINGTNIGVIMMDIDFFKKFNDMKGHDYGDKCLEYVASVIKENCMEKEAIPIRHGGEEIVILLNDTTLAKTYAFAENLRKEIEENGIETPYKEISNNVTVSIGISLESIKELNAYEDILANADAMLYKAKESGRNQVYPKI